MKQKGNRKKTDYLCLLVKFNLVHKIVLRVYNFQPGTESLALYCRRLV